MACAFAVVGDSVTIDFSFIFTAAFDTDLSTVVVVWLARSVTEPTAFDRPCASCKIAWTMFQIDRSFGGMFIPDTDHRRL